MPSPMIKATLAAAALSSASNVLAQFLEAYRDARPFTFETLHFVRFVILAFITAPPNYLWQQFLERSFPARDRPPCGGRDADFDDVRKDKDEEEGYEQQRRDEHYKPKLNWKNTWSKWFIDCISLGAIMNTVAFFILMGLMKGQDIGQIARNIRTETIPLIIAGYKIWPFASIVSFSCVPVEKRIVFLNFVGLLWGIYMSLVAARV